jgi:hypothetical protein
MKILFVVLNTGYVRTYDSALRELAARGHRIHIAVQVSRNKMGESITLNDLVRDFPGVTASQAAEPEDGLHRTMARSVRELVDYMRYLEPRYKSAFALRQRAADQIPKSFVRLAHVIAFFGQPVVRLVMRALLRLEWAVPRSEAVRRFVDEHAPDILLVTPLVERSSSQVDYIKEAAYRGLPSGLCVASWDNLTNKGLMRIVPDRVFLWNAWQRREAVDLHGVPPDRIVETGAQLFDQWFTWRSRRTREEFCRQVGLDPQKPYILYLGSSAFIAPNEAEFIDRWLDAVRNVPSPVQDYGVLIRPHPNNSQPFLGLDLTVFGNAAIWPPFDENYYAHDSRDDFFDSIAYSEAVAGVNTSALIEAAIVGRGSCTVLAPDFAHSQEGTLHFQLIARGDSALLRVAKTFEEHVAHLGETAHPTDDVRRQIATFVKEFVRPHGLETPAAIVLAGAIERMEGLQAPRREPSPFDAVLRVLMAPPTAIARIIWRRAFRERRQKFDASAALARRWAQFWVRYQIWRANAQVTPAVAVVAGVVAPKPTAPGRSVRDEKQRARAARKEAEARERAARRAVEAQERAARRDAEKRKLNAKEREREEKERRKAARREEKEAAAEQRRKQEPVRSRLPVPVRSTVNNTRLSLHRLRKRVGKAGRQAIDRTRRAGRRTVRQLVELGARLRPR